MSRVKVLFVCLGNICRSPTAHGVMRDLVRQAGLEGSITVDSAGTSDWHVGAPPDERTVLAASKRHYDLSDLRGRQVQLNDFQHFDYILAMDKDNLSNLNALRSTLLEGQSFAGQLELLLNYTPCADGGFASKKASPLEVQPLEVPDPYYGGVTGFDHVLDLVEDACQNLLQHLVQRYQL